LFTFLLTFSNSKESGFVSPEGGDKFIAKAPCIRARAAKDDTVDRIGYVYNFAFIDVDKKGEYRELKESWGVGRKNGKQSGFKRSRERLEAQR
jgi:hypothetical protein